MEFKFKRKYASFHLMVIILHLLVVAFWLLFPYLVRGTPKDRVFFTLLALVNVEFIILLYLGLFTKKYIAYYDKLIIKRALAKSTTITYGTILNIKENIKDSKSQSSFQITYIGNNRKKHKVTVRCDNTELLLKVIKNEIKIAKN